MYAVVVTTRLTEEADPEAKVLQEQIIPAVKQTPGFVSATFLSPVDEVGLSVVLFDSEEAARGAAGAMGVQPGASLAPGSTVETVAFIEVVATA